MQALPAPTTQIDALPYIDTQYNDPAVQKQVDELVQSEMRSFKPKDYLSRWPVYEPDFDVRRSPSTWSLTRKLTRRRAAHSRPPPPLQPPDGFFAVSLLDCPASSPSPLL